MFLQALQEDVVTLEPSVTNVNYVVRMLSTKTADDLQCQLTGMIDDLNKTWHQVVSDSRLKNERLNEALDRTRQLKTMTDSLDYWLGDIEADIPAAAVINSTSELSVALRKLNSLKNRIELRAAEANSLIETGTTRISN